MKKGMIIVLVAFVAAVCLMFITACGERNEQEKYAKGRVPVICQQQDGKFSYYSPVRKYAKVYPISLLDSIRALPRTPEMNVSYRTLSKDSFKVIVFAPVECLLSDMDKLKFIYPPEAKYSVREDIFWSDNEEIALAPKFWLVGIKNKITHVYTPEGRKLSLTEANAILRIAVDKPQAEPDTVQTTTTSLAPPITVLKAYEKPSK